MAVTFRHDPVKVEVAPARPVVVRMMSMSVTLELPEDVLHRLTSEAERRGTRLVDVIVDLAAHLPPAEPSPRRKLAFVGAGASEAGITPRMAQLLADGFGQD